MRAKDKKLERKELTTRLKPAIIIGRMEFLI